MKEKLTGILNKTKEKARSFFESYWNSYGILGLAAVVLVVLKTVVFYILMNTGSHFISVCLVTLLFTFLLFKAFRNKWIPAVLFLYCPFLCFAMLPTAAFLIVICQSV